MTSSSSLDLAELFSTVTQVLAQNREQLNQADTHNGDHGDHVLEVFELVTQVAREHPDAEPAQILELASQRLREKPHGTAQTYAQTMHQTAQQLKGQPLTEQTLPTLLAGLLGVQQPQQAETGGQADLGNLLGNLLGGGAEAQSDALGGLGDLLGGLLGGGAQQGGGLSDGLDAGDVLRAGMAFLQDRQRGGSGLGAALQALIGNSTVGQTPHRAQSAQLIVTALLQALQQRGR